MECPKGHDNVDYVDWENGFGYCFCYDCIKKYFRENYELDNFNKMLNEEK
jgi:hypothetical protein